MGKLLNQSTSMMCPHGGTVSVVTSNTRAKAGGAFILRPSDTFTIAGCPFTLPSGTPHPCVTVQWVKSCLRVKAAGDYALADDSVGLCLAADQAPQGPVNIVSTQPRASGL